MAGMNAALAAEIEAAITAMLVRLHPAVKGREMYGGTYFESEPGVHKTGFCGVFCYTHHVSLAFTKGALLDDPQGVLEGDGKLRRHIKLRSMADLDTKGVKDYLRRAIVL